MSYKTQKQDANDLKTEDLGKMAWHAPEIRRSELIDRTRYGGVTTDDLDGVGSVVPPN